MRRAVAWRLEFITVYYGMGPCSVLAFYSAYWAVIPAPCVLIHTLWDSRHKVGCLLQCCIISLSSAASFITKGRWMEDWEHALTAVFWVFAYMSWFFMVIRGCNCESWERFIKATEKERDKVIDQPLFIEEIITYEEKKKRRSSQKFQPDFSLACHHYLCCCFVFDFLDGAVSLSVNLPHQTAPSREHKINKKGRVSEIISSFIRKGLVGSCRPVVQSWGGLCATG